MYYLKIILPFILMVVYYHVCRDYFSSSNVWYKEAEVEKSNTLFNETISNQILKDEREEIIITRDIDLRGLVWKLPPESTLLFKGGVIKNGTIVGNNTIIKRDGICFDHVMIEGTWNVPYISTSMFGGLNEVNVLKNVMALSNPNIKNTVVVEEGDYKIKALKNDDKILMVNDNTTLLVNGVVTLEPNDFERYSILCMEGENITVKGEGHLVGDKHSHLGKTGEWGMGIEFKGAVNATVKGITVKDCWGDCMYVGGDSRNVVIENCFLDSGRRQGISITKANGVIIRDCMITNVHGTNPQYAIDIEPNRLDCVDYVMVENVTVKDCEGGFLVTRGESKKGVNTPWIGSIVIRNCHVSSKSRVPIRVRRCLDIEVKSCTISWVRGKTAMSFLDVDNVVVENNILRPAGGLYEALRQKTKELLGRDDGQVIKMDSVRQKRIHYNRILNNDELK